LLVRFLSDIAPKKNSGWHRGSNRQPEGIKTSREASRRIIDSKANRHKIAGLRVHSNLPGNQEIHAASKPADMKVSRKIFTLDILNIFQVPWDAVVATV